MENEKKIDTKDMQYLEFSSKLNGEYAEAFKKIEMYGILQGNSVEYDDFNDMMLELVDLFSEAEKHKKPVEKIIGDDVGKFCEEFFAERKSWLNSLKSIPSLINILCWFRVFSGMIDIWTYEGAVSSILQIKMNLNFIVSTLIGCVLAEMLLLMGRILLFRWKRFTLKMYLILDVAVAVVVIGLAAAFVPDSEIEIPIIYTVIVCGGYIVVYKLLQLYDRYKKYGSIKRPESEKTFWGEVKSSWNEGWNEGTAEVDSLDIYEKAYMKKNAKLRKRGKPEISEEAYTEKYRKDTKLYEHIDVVLTVIYTVITAFVILQEFGNSSWKEALLSTVIFVVIAAVIGRFFIKIEKETYRERVAYLKRCDEEGITIIELARRVKEEK